MEKGTTSSGGEAEAQYFCKDFHWEDLRAEVEANPSYAYHFESASSSSSSTPPESDVLAWKQFHLRHASGTFFKERRYLLKEFPELLSCSPNSKLLEVGCGNGSTALPILRANKDLTVYACDCSDETLERATEIISDASPSFQHRFRTFCCDLSTNGFPTWLACYRCRDKFLQKQSYCLSDVREGNGLHFTNTYPSEEVECCVGGVDFITLV